MLYSRETFELFYFNFISIVRMLLKLLKRTQKEISNDQQCTRIKPF